MTTLLGLYHKCHHTVMPLESFSIFYFLPSYWVSERVKHLPKRSCHNRILATLDMRLRVWSHGPFGLFQRGPSKWQYLLSDPKPYKGWAFLGRSRPKRHLGKPETFQKSALGLLFWPFGWSEQVSQVFSLQKQLPPIWTVSSGLSLCWQKSIWSLPHTPFWPAPGRSSAGACWRWSCDHSPRVPSYA